MNIYLKKELTLRDMPSYYVVFETYNKTLVYEITYDYIVIRKDISFSDIKKDYMLIDEFLKHSLYIERKEINENDNVICCYNNTIFLVEANGVLCFEYDEAYQLGENINTKYTIEEIKDKLIYRANELFNGSTLETINEIFENFVSKENVKFINDVTNIVNKEMSKEDISRCLLNLNESYTREDLRKNMYKELKRLRQTINNKKMLEKANDEILDAYNYLTKKLSKK